MSQSRIGVRVQTDREVSELIAKFRTPPGMNWKPLADDIETLLKVRARSPVNEPCQTPFSDGYFAALYLAVERISAYDEKEITDALRELEEMIRRGPAEELTNRPPPAPCAAR